VSFEKVGRSPRLYRTAAAAQHEPLEHASSEIAALDPVSRLEGQVRDADEFQHPLTVSH
jgi:hypothetical protein